MAKDIANYEGPLGRIKVLCFRGATVKSLFERIGTLNLDSLTLKCFVVHVGTNDIGGSAEWRKYLQMVNGRITSAEYDSFLALNNPHDMDIDRFATYYVKLIDYVRQKLPDVWIFCSPVIPRPWDHSRRDGERRFLNLEIQAIAASYQYRVIYLDSYRMFFKDLKENTLKTWYFKDDGLHLSLHGTKALRSFWFDKINKIMKGIIKDGH